jgi:hypothetical protein
MGAAGTLAIIAPNVISACSIELPIRIASGRSAPRPRSSSACASPRARAQASA